MPSITCNCGFKVENEDPYNVEAQAWHHAIKEHLEMLKNLSEKDIENILINNDRQMDKVS